MSENGNTPIKAEQALMDEIDAEKRDFTSNDIELVKEKIVENKDVFFANEEDLVKVIESNLFSRSMRPGVHIYTERLLSRLLAWVRQYIMFDQSPEGKYSLPHIIPSSDLQIALGDSRLPFVYIPTKKLLMNDNDSNYTAAKRAIRELAGMSFEVERKVTGKDGRQYYVFEKANMIMNVNVNKYKGWVGIRPSDTMWRLLFDFAKGYTYYELTDAMNITKPEALRLYRLLCKRTKVWCVSFEYLRKLLGNDSYKRSNSEWTKKVLIPAKKEIEENTSIRFTYSLKSIICDSNGDALYEEYYDMSKLRESGRGRTRGATHICFERTTDSGVDEQIRFTLDRGLVAKLKFYGMPDKMICDNIELFQKAVGMFRLDGVYNIISRETSLFGEEEEDGEIILRTLRNEIEKREAKSEILLPEIKFEAETPSLFPEESMKPSKPSKDVKKKASASANSRMKVSDKSEFVISDNEL